MPKLNFSVDAKLLEELGERLVPKPSIALGELVKNAYDADAHLVTIEFHPEQGLISVEDDGHGMTFDDFKYFWMRIGTTHKAKKQSPYLGRHMTGSKGVGRLAVQLLAHRLDLQTVPKQQNEDRNIWLKAHVDWDRAVKAGELTSATVEYDKRSDAPPFRQGTKIILNNLKHEWTSDDLKELAREIWYLQPPFRRPGDRIPEKERFEVQLIGAEDYRKEFEAQLRAIMEIQGARLVGYYENGVAHLAIEFWRRGTPYKTLRYTYYVKDAPHNTGDYDPQTNLNRAEFEIRIYRMSGRQPKGLRLDDVKDYMERFGGVHVYDGGFRLPFYGTPENDWLRIEYDHAHRSFVSRLLPKEIDEAYKHTARLQYLPTLRRVFGIVQVDTSIEKNLDIAITRDRLLETTAYEDLVYIVRYAFDQYAYDEALRNYEESARDKPTEVVSERLERVEEVLKAYRPQIPAQVYKDLATNIQQTVKAVKSEQENALVRLSLLGPLATAGISAIAIQHELRKQFAWLRRTIDQLRSIAVENEETQEQLRNIANELEAWLERAKATNAIFDYMTPETIQERERYRVRVVIEEVLRQLSFLARGIEIDYSAIDPSLYLPEGSFAEWAAILQNVFTNAFNAMQDSTRRLLKIESRQSGLNRRLLIMDTGSGVDLKRSQEYFEPFKRGIETPRYRSAVGYGGTGLGLTIVRLLCERIGCSARFIEPDEDFNTAFMIEWQESLSRRKRNED